MQQRDEGLRLRWEATLAQWSADQLVFCDESASNERTLDWKRGWAPQGLPCRVRWNSTRSKRWSILPAIALEGYISYDIYHGGYNAQRFNEFIRSKLLPRMNPFPGPLSVLILDNASCHRSKELKDKCEDSPYRFAANLNRYERSLCKLVSVCSSPKTKAIVPVERWIRRHVDNETPSRSAMKLK